MTKNSKYNISAVLFPPPKKNLSKQLEIENRPKN